MINARLVGDKALRRLLDSLEPKVRKRILRPAVAAAARPIRMAAKQGAPRFKSLLAKSMGVKVRSKRSTAIAVVGPRTDIAGPSVNLFGEPIESRPVKYAHLAESGTEPHDITIVTSDGRIWTWRHPGTPATHFFEQAYESTKGRAEDILNERILKGIKRFA